METSSNLLSTTDSSQPTHFSYHPSPSPSPSTTANADPIPFIRRKGILSLLVDRSLTVDGTQNDEGRQMLPVLKTERTTEGRGNSEVVGGDGAKEDTEDLEKAEEELVFLLIGEDWNEVKESEKVKEVISCIPTNDVEANDEDSSLLLPHTIHLRLRVTPHSPAPLVDTPIAGELSLYFETATELVVAKELKTILRSRGIRFDTALIPPEQIERAVEEEERLVLVDSTSGEIIASLSPPSQSLPSKKNSPPSTLSLAAALLAQGIVAGSGALAHGIEGAAEFVVLNTRKKEEEKEKKKEEGEEGEREGKSGLERWRGNIEASHQFTTGASEISKTTFGYIGSAAGRLGGVVGRSIGIQPSRDGPPPSGIMGILSEVVGAVGTVATSLEAGSETLFNSTVKSTANVVQHTMGQEVAELTGMVGGSIRNVALVYIDAQGATKKAIIKSIGSATSLPENTPEVAVVVAPPELKTESDNEVKKLVEMESSSKGN